MPSNVNVPSDTVFDYYYILSGTCVFVCVCRHMLPLTHTYTHTQHSISHRHTHTHTHTHNTLNITCTHPHAHMHRSPSPEPIYSHDGKRLNTREVRVRKKLEDERHELVQQAINLNPEYRPPTDYKYVAHTCSNLTTNYPWNKDTINWKLSIVSPPPPGGS